MVYAILTNRMEDQIHENKKENKILPLKKSLQPNPDVLVYQSNFNLQ